jgi:hypothetical protein
LNKREKLKIFLLSFLILNIFNACQDSENQELDSNSSEKTSLRISGIAIDGYISGGDVELLDQVTKTDENGSWEFIFPISQAEDLKESFVSITNGIDISTGENYKGVIRVPIVDLHVSVIGTPITTIISGMMNDEKNSSEAYKDLSVLINIPVDILLKDHIEMIEYGVTAEEKIVGIKTLKTALVFQKSIEIISDAIDGGSHESFLAVTQAVGNIINNEFVNSEQNISYVEIFTNSEYLVSEMNLTEIQTSRFENSIPSIIDLINQINAINEDGYVSDTTENKDLDFLSKLENEIKVIDILALKTSSLITSNFEDPENISAYRTDFINIISILGGVDSIGNIVAENNISAKDFYEKVFTNDFIIENTKQANELLERAEIDPVLLPDILLSIMNIPYDYENENYSLESVGLIKKNIEEVIKKELEYEILFDFMEVMTDIKQVLVEANLNVSSFDE